MISTDEHFKNFAQWHHDRNLVEGATDETQFIKLLEEVIELYMCLNPGLSALYAACNVRNHVADLLNKNRIKPEVDHSNLPDAIGDINVVLTNFMERHGITPQEAFARSWGDIKDRKGRMVDGQFVKEADL